MAAYPQISVWILVVTSVTLFWVALTDFREFRIPNELVLALVGLYVLYSLVSGGSPPKRRRSKRRQSIRRACLTDL